MRIALIDTTKNMIEYPLGLLRIGAWRKSLGDHCELFLNKIPKGRFDEAWLSTVFTFDMVNALKLIRGIRGKVGRVCVGGISATLFPDFYKKEGVDIHEGLLPEADEFIPDYSLLKEEPEYCISRTSRGCIRKCKFCMVKDLEPEFFDISNWERDVQRSKTGNVIFYDNNWLAKPIDSLRKDSEKIIELKDAGIISHVDFKQGLDCKLVDDERADVLASLPMQFIRFAFDGLHQDGYFQKTLLKLADRGVREFRNYLLYNFNDKPEDFYYRLRVGSEIVGKHENVGRVAFFPMKFQPIESLNLERNFIGKHWTKKRLRSIKTLINMYSGPKQTFAFFKSDNSFSTIKEVFEFWFGKTEKDFVKMLDYPKVDLLLRRKASFVRQKRVRKG